MAGDLSVETCGEVFYPKSRQASSNYGVDSKGRVGMYVEEKNRSWCSSSPENDHRAITIEVANDEFGGNWHVSDKALEKTIELCVDICRRNGIKRLNYTGDTRGNLTKHEWFANTNCPGPYLGSKFPYIASELNKRLGVAKSKTITININTKSSVYRVRKSWEDAKSQKGAFKILDNAKKCADKNKGYFVFGEKGKLVYPVTSSKSVDNIAREVISGKWGNGDGRKRRLTNAGYDYNLVQDRVNSILSNKPVNKKSLEEVAREVILGKWGKGDERKRRLTNAGYNYKEVQKIVNQIL